MSSLLVLFFVKSEREIPVSNVLLMTLSSRSVLNCEVGTGDLSP